MHTQQDPTRSSGARTILHSCPKFGQDYWALTFPRESHIGWGPPGEGRGLGWGSYYAKLPLKVGFKQHWRRLGQVLHSSGIQAVRHFQQDPHVYDHTPDHVVLANFSTMESPRPARGECFQSWRLAGQEFFPQPCDLLKVFLAPVVLPGCTSEKVRRSRGEC